MMEKVDGNRDRYIGGGGNGGQREEGDIGEVENGRLGGNRDRKWDIKDM